MASFSSPVGTTRDYIPIVGLSAIRKLGYTILLCPNTTTLEQWRVKEVANIASSVPIWPTGQLIRVLTEADGVFRKWNGVSSFTTISWGSSSVEHYKGNYSSLEDLELAFPTASNGDYAIVNDATNVFIYFYDETDSWTLLNPVSKFKGLYLTVEALNSAYPTAEAGDYAQVDAGSGSDLILYLYDLDEGWIQSGSTSPVPGTTDDLTEGSTNLYFTNNRVLSYLQGLASKTTLDLGDKISFLDSAASYVGKYLTFDNLITNLQGFFVDLSTSQNISGTKTFTNPQIIDVTSSSSALRITQTGSGSALLVEDTTHTDTTPFEISSDGTIGIGTAASLNNAISIDKTISGSTTGNGINLAQVINYDVSSIARGLNIDISTGSHSGTPYALAEVSFLNLSFSTKHADSTITNNYGIKFNTNFIKGTNNYGIYIPFAAGANNYGIYISSAKCNLGGDVDIGGNLAITGTATGTTPSVGSNDTNFATTAFCNSYFIKKPTSTPVTDGHLAVFDGTTGLLLKDGGAVPSGGSGLSGLGSIDNSLIRTDGVSGNAIQNSSIIVEDSGQISGYSAKIIEIGTSTYTLQASDCGKVLVFTYSSTITVTLPNSLAAGFLCNIYQDGAGQVAFSTASGAVLRNRQSHNKLKAQYAQATLWVRSNSDNVSAIYILQGDTST